MQVNIFETIPEEIWDLKIEATKGNRDKYNVEDFKNQLFERLSDIPDERKKNRFVSDMIAYVFDTNRSRGIHTNKTIQEVYEYEYNISSMGDKGIILKDKYFYEESYICLKGYTGSWELVIEEITDDYVSVSHRFNKDFFYKVYNSVEELSSDMWTLDEIKETLDNDLEHKSVDELYSILRLLHQIRFNYDYGYYDYNDKYVRDFDKRCLRTLARKGEDLAKSMSEKDFLQLVSDKTYNSLWDTTKNAINNGDKVSAISALKKQYNLSGGTFSHKSLTIGYRDNSTKGVKIDVGDGTDRNYLFSWNTIYDCIMQKLEPEQIDMFSMVG